jgi:hypothetical protein
MSKKTNAKLREQTKVRPTFCINATTISGLFGIPFSMNA